MGKSKTNFIAIGVPFLAIALIIVGFFAFRHEMKYGLRQRTYAILAEVADQQETVVTARLEGAYQILNTVAAVAENLESGTVTGQQQVVELLSITTKSTDFSQMAIVDEKGNAWLDSGFVTNVAKRQYFQDAMAGGRGFERVSANIRSGDAKYCLSLPIRRNGEVAGIVFGAYSLAGMADILATNAYNGEAYCYTCDTAGQIAIGSNHKYYPDDMENALTYFSGVAMQDGMTVETLAESLSRHQPVMLSFADDGRTWYATFMPMAPTGWFMVNVVPEDSVTLTNQFINVNATYMVLFIFVMGVITVLYTYLHERGTIRKLEEEQFRLRESEKRNDLLNQLSNEVLFQGEMGTGTLHYNRSFQALFGYEPVGGRIEDAGGARVYPADRAQFQTMMNQIRSGVRQVSTELRIVNAYGRPIWQRLDVFTVEGENGAIDSFIGKLTNIERQKSTIQRLLKQAESDALTGAMNRAGLLSRVDGYLREANPDKFQALFMLDVDDFKHQNDTYGHQEGDRVLKLLAEHLQRLFRSSDYVCRMGGDEFAVFMKDAASYEQVRAKAQELCDSTALLEGLIQRKITVSVGVALFSRDGHDFEELYARADEALYQAKANGKACFRVYGE